MTYETPELIALMPAISAVHQTASGSKVGGAGETVHPLMNDVSSAYEDWE